MAFYKKRLFKNIVTVLLSYGLGQLALLIATPFLTRLYSPSLFSVFGYILSFSGMLLAVASLRYEYAIPLLKRQSAVALLSKICCVLVLLTSVFIFFVSFGFVSYLQNIGINFALIIICFLVLLLQGLAQVYSMVLLSAGKVLQVSYGKIIQNIGMVILQIGLAFVFHASALILCLGLVFGLFLNVIYYQVLLKNSIYILKPTACKISFFLKRYYKFPLFTCWTNLIDGASTFMPIFLIGPFYGSKALGLYFLVSRVFSAPTGLLAKAVSQVMIKELADHVKNKLKIMPIFLKLTFSLGAVALFYYLIMLLISYYVGAILGEQWLDAGPVLRLLAPVIAIILCVSPLTIVFLMLNRNGTASCWQVIYLIFTLGLIMYERHQDFMTMLLHLVCVWFLLYIAYWLLMFKTIRKWDEILCIQLR